MAFETTICQECPTPIQWPTLRAAYLRCINIALDTRDAMLKDRDARISALESQVKALENGKPAACDLMKCNPICLRCGDTPSCGDGSWSWMDGVHRHRCRDLHPQCGHDRVPCEHHQPGELIAMLREEVKALRITRDVKIVEVDRLEKERDAQAEAVRVLGMCVEARRREKVARDGFHAQDATKQTHTHHEWTKAIEDRFTSDGLVDANPIARAAVEGGEA